MYSTIGLIIAFPFLVAPIAWCVGELFYFLHFYINDEPYTGGYVTEKAEEISSDASWVFPTILFGSPAIGLITLFVWPLTLTIVLGWVGVAYLRHLKRKQKDEA